MKQTFIVRILFFTLICPPILAGKNGQQNDDTELKQTSPKKTEKPAAKVTTNPSVKYVKVQTSTTAPVAATTSPNSSDVIQSASTESPAIPSAAHDVPQAPKSETLVSVTPTQEITTHDIRFSKKRANYVPIDPYVPEQVYIGIGYDAVLKDVQSVTMSTKLSPVDIEAHRTKVSKALRDIYGYLNKAIQNKQFNEAQKYITTLIELAVTAHNRSLLPDDKRDNVCAWLKRYHESINQYEATQSTEINKWRYKATKENNQDQKIPHFQELAIALGLQDDYMKALDDLKHLDPNAVSQENRSHFSATINELLANVSQQAVAGSSLDEQAQYIGYFAQALTNAHTNKIPLDPEQLVATNKVINTIKKTNRDAIKKAILLGKQLESQLKKTQTQTLEIAQKSFGQSITDQFSDEKSDDISFEAFLASFNNDDQKEV